MSKGKKKIEEKNIKDVEEKEEELLELDKKVKKEKDADKKSLFSRIMNIILWIILIAWMAVVLVDYFKVTEEKDPMFCISKHTTKYDDGNVEVCTGLGYKVYRYNRDSFKAIEFGPFWIKDRSAESDK